MPLVFQWFLILLPSLSMVFNGSGPLVKRCDGFDGSLWSSPCQPYHPFYRQGGVENIEVGNLCWVFRSNSSPSPEPQAEIGRPPLILLPPVLLLPEQLPVHHQSHLACNPVQGEAASYPLEGEEHGRNCIGQLGRPSFASYCV